MNAHERPSTTGSKIPLRLAHNMSQYAGVICMDHPASQRQPIKNRIEFEFVRCALDDFGTTIRMVQEFETGGDRAEVTDRVRSMHVPIRAQLSHCRHIIEHDECKFSVGDP